MAVTTAADYNFPRAEPYQPPTIRPATGGPLTVDQPTTIAAAGGGIQPGQVGGSLGAGIGGGIGNLLILAGAGGKGGKEELKQALAVWQKLQTPDFDMRDLDPAEFKIAAEMFPEEFAAQLPGEASLIADSPLVRAQQAQALRGMGEIATGGLPEADRLAAMEAQRSVRGAIQGGEEAAITSMRRRGRLGAGQELQARTAGGREASDLAARLGSDLQRQALERRMQALSQYGSMAGAQRGQDLGVEQSRADAMNRFKEFAATQRQGAEQYSAGARERAQGYNVGTTQAIADANQAAQYQTALENLQRQNQARADTFTAGQIKAQGEAGALGALSQAEYAKKAAKEAQIRGVSSGLGGAVGGIVGGLL